MSPLTIPPAQVYGDSIDVSDWQAIVDSITFLANPPGCTLRHSTTQSHTTNTTWQAVTFDTEHNDPAGLHSAGSPTRITIVTAGVYLFVASLEFAANATGHRAIGLRKNSSGTNSPDFPYMLISNNGAGLGTGVHTATRVKLAAGDYMEVVAWQSSGGALNISGPGFNMPEFACQWVGLG